ncbi:MAG: aminopeptidase, partial [Thermoplasmatota archaeon]
MAQGKDEKAKKKARRSPKEPHSWKRKWSVQQKLDVQEVERLSSLYMEYLDSAKTEREAVSYWCGRLLDNGFFELTPRTRRKPKPGDGFFVVNRDKQIAAGIVGKAEIQKGVNMVVTHLDSPRIDLKPLPLDGDPETGLGILRTHYYGGIKKYHWVNIPLSLHGRVVRSDGSFLDLSIGEDEKDPVFLIPDLEPHLSKNVQNKRKISEAIHGEEMLALIGSGPVLDDGEERSPVVGDVLSYLNREYGLREEDLISSDLTLVPSWGARDIGLDRGLIGAYGHDNR